MFLDCSIINIPVSVRERNVGVLNSVENHVQNVRCSDVPGCEKFSDEDSRDVEEEDDPEDKESFVEVQSSVEGVGRRNWRVGVFIVPPYNRI